MTAAALAAAATAAAVAAEAAAAAAADLAAAASAAALRASFSAAIFLYMASTSSEDVGADLSPEQQTTWSHSCCG